MGRTLLIGSSRTTWREWLKRNREDRDLLCLDPADPHQGIPGRLSLFRDDHPLYTRLYGSLDPLRSPHLLVAAAAEGLERMGSDGIVQFFTYRPSPLVRQTTRLIAGLVRPERILVAGEDVDMRGLEGEIETVLIEEALPATVRHAQRKAQWMRMFEECEQHELDMREVAIEGVRLGSGRILSPEERERAALRDALYVERCGAGLLVVSPTEPSEGQVSRALDVTGATRAFLVEPDAYDHLICAFARPNGEEIGMGTLLRIDWENHRMHLLNTAVAPTVVATLRLGSLRVLPDGREIGETRPGQV